MADPEPNDRTISTTNSTATDSYALKRGFQANTRLTAQHYLWKDTLKFNLHKDIPIPPYNARIADVATGNGLWLLDLLPELPPSTQLDGFDISLDQCPPLPWLPTNVKLHTWDMFNHPPSEFVGVFDIVHVRLITCVIKTNDPRPVLSNLHKLLKPGGWLQWDEVDSLDCHVKAINSSVSTNEVERLLRQLGGADDWKRTMTETINQNSFGDVRLSRFEYNEVMARYWNDMYMCTWEEFAKTVLKTPTASAKLATDALEQVRNGSAIMVPKLVWVAQRI